MNCPHAKAIRGSIALLAYIRPNMALVAMPQSGVMTPSQLVEIGEIVAGRARGRRAADEITIFKSVGIAVQDAAIAALLYDKALAGGVGVNVALGA